MRSRVSVKQGKLGFKDYYFFFLKPERSFSLLTSVLNKDTWAYEHSFETLKKIVAVAFTFVTLFCRWKSSNLNDPTYSSFTFLGSTMDENGNHRIWWSPESRKNFENRTSCLVDYYSQYKINGEHINGRNTVGENLADITGITTAYQVRGRNWKRVIRWQCKVWSLHCTWEN